MSWIKICVCNSCGKELRGDDIEKSKTGYLHTCKECQIKEWGFFLGDKNE